jgi:hypothetical protein
MSVVPASLEAVLDRAQDDLAPKCGRPVRPSLEIDSPMPPLKQILTGTRFGRLVTISQVYSRTSPVTRKAQVSSASVMGPG